MDQNGNVDDQRAAREEIERLVSPEIIDFVVIERTAKVVVRVPKHTYRAGKDNQSRVMTDQEIVDYERSMTGEEAFQALIEAASVVDEDSITQSLEVTFTVGRPSESDV